MTKEELEKEAEEYALKQWEGNIPWSVIQKSYYDGALPREKQIQIDAEQIRALQKQNGELTDELAELKALLNCNNCSELSEEECESCAEYSHFKCKRKDQLTIAKEHIRTLISCLIDYIVPIDKDYFYITEAEQFLKNNA